VLCLLPDVAGAALRESVADEGLDIVVTATVGELISELARRSWAATLVSLSSDQVDAQVVQRLGAQKNAGALILTTPAPSLQWAVLAEEAGAAALVREPVTADELRECLGGATDEGRAVRIPAADDAGGPPGVPGLPQLLGWDPAMDHVFRTIARVARSDATVLLTGESGTGKELVARAIHATSGRRDGPFVAVNCAAIPEHLLESELFGHEKGAFTGAVSRRVGRFERANGGTLFLDEIGDMSLVLQAKVLRALEERVVERVGGESSYAVELRVIAATNRDIAGAIRDGSFREDLYFRLAVVELRLPPLRDRGADVKTLALHFARQAAARHGRPVRVLTTKALRHIEEASWPGNVRELRNVMDRAVLLANGSTIRSTDLRIGAVAPRASAQAGAEPHGGYPTTLSLAQVESDHLRRVLESVGGRIARAASILGIHRNTLAHKMREYGIGIASSNDAVS
jgi:DNA-binding NtrC family response regulator